VIEWKNLNFTATHAGNDACWIGRSHEEVDQQP
jgi:hypothetical protein